MAGFLGILAIAVAGSLLWHILAAQTEVMRRVRAVVVGLFALWVALILYEGGGPVAVLAALAIIGAGVWIYKGAK